MRQDTLLLPRCESCICLESGLCVFTACCSESVPLLSVGASLIVVIPSAFVSLSVAVRNLSPPARLRVVSSGAFHNAVYFLLLIAMARSGLGRLYWSVLGYEYIGHFGRVVLSTHEVRNSSHLLHHILTTCFQHSSLHDSVPNGAVITSLDDLQLTSSDLSLDLWTSYLSHSEALEVSSDIGWCVEAKQFLGMRVSSLHPHAHSDHSPISARRDMLCCATSRL